MILSAVVLTAAICAGDGGRLWRPVEDTPYLQEVGRQVVTDKPVRAVATCAGRVYAGFDDGVRVLEGTELSACGAPHGPVRKMAALNDALWVIADSGLHRFRDGAWRAVAEGEYADLCVHGGEVCVAGERALWRVAGDGLVPIDGAEKCPGRILGVASYSETLYVVGEKRLALFDGHGFDGVNVVDWGQLPAGTVRDMHPQGNRLYIATDRGLAVLRGMSMTHLGGPEGLCYEDTTCLGDGFDGDLWIGTTMGAIRHTAGAFHYFAGVRWLPDDHVNAVAAADREIYIATNGGLGIIAYEPFTLLKKAAYYERHLEEWGQKRLGFVHKLEWDDAEGEWMREISDNDAGWSTHYLTAQCFKYAVTGDEQARDEALHFFKSLKWCEEITPIDGYPARSVWAKGERGHQATGGSGGYPAEWHDTPDGVWQWKGDTSSDETDAHFYATAIFHDLAAQGEEKEWAKEHLARLMDHIMENGWVLRDLDGKPTRWGRWDPEYFHSYQGHYARGLNGMEVLTYLATAHAITGDAKYAAAADELIGMHYLDEVLRQKLVFPPDSLFHSDDRLAFYCYFTLLRCETDPTRRSLYRRSLERSWEIERIEHNPWFNFIYGALTGNDCEAPEAVAHLREWPLDCVTHPYRNSHRHDLHTPAGYVPYAGGVKAISPRERGPQRWTSPTLQFDGGSGREVMDPSGWLDAYWMGRYFGFITAPDTDDASLTTVEERGLHVGARPYEGPARP
ncbi:MAG: hypothetical protein JXR94_02990 [Candidatus Hydrogenedentes bacterium]|nr:hypothetical protein [Candidatus Hydrogenedentota bacterium]